MAEIQMKGFPDWTETEDVKVTIQSTGCTPVGVWWTNNIVNVRFQTLEIAKSACWALNGFEMTPGYPLMARLSPGSEPASHRGKGESKSVGKGGGGKDRDVGKGYGKSYGTGDVVKGYGKSYGKSYGKGYGMPYWAAEFGSTGSGKGGEPRYVRSEEPRTEDEEPRLGDWQCPTCGFNVFGSKIKCPKCGTLKESDGAAAILEAKAKEEPVILEGPGTIGNCVGAGRLEGWIFADKSKAESVGWGYVKSYAFSGNLAFRLKYSPLLADAEWKMNDPVSFEVVILKGQCEGIHVALPSEEHEAPEPGTAIPDEEKEEREKRKEWTQEEWEEWRREKKRKERREAESNDPRFLFFVFDKACSERQVRRFAEEAGEVIKINLFVDQATQEPKGCGKVLYATEEMAAHALHLLKNKMLNDRPVSIQKLGQEQRKKPKLETVPVTEDRPMILPMSLHSSADSPTQKMEICKAAFSELMATHDEKATGQSMIYMVRSLIKEVNDLFCSDPKTLNQFFFVLKTHPWFEENLQVLRWQAAKNKINISKFSPSSQALAAAGEMRRSR